MRGSQDPSVREIRKAPDAVGIGRRKADRGQAGMPFAYRFHRREVSRRVVCDETNGRESIENALIEPVSVEDFDNYMRSTRYEVQKDAFVTDILREFAKAMR